LIFLVRISGEKQPKKCQKLLTFFCRSDIIKMSKVFDTSVLIKYRKEPSIMPVGAIIFLAVVLVVFLVLDIIMLVSLLRPGDERNQIIAWKASSFTLLAMVGANILSVIENFVRAQPMTQNPFIQLEVAAIVYFIALMYYKRKHGG
jgi:hypothetical protein